MDNNKPIMNYYTTYEINEIFDRETRVKIAKLIWTPKPTKIIAVPILCKN